MNGLLGGNSTGGTIGSGVGSLAGAAIGSIVPGIGTLIGGLIGGGAGGIFGGLFGGGQSVGPNGLTQLRYKDGHLVLGGSGADNGADVNATIQTATTTMQALNALIDNYGLKLSAAVNTVKIGNNPNAGDVSGIYQGSVNAGKPTDTNSYFAWLIKSQLLSGDGTSGTIVKNVGSQGLDTTIKALDFGKLYDQLQSLTKPLTDVETAMKALRDAADAAAAQAADVKKDTRICLCGWPSSL